MYAVRGAVYVFSGALEILIPFSLGYMLKRRLGKLEVVLRRRRDVPRLPCKISFEPVRLLRRVDAGLWEHVDHARVSGFSVAYGGGLRGGGPLHSLQVFN